MKYIIMLSVLCFGSSSLKATADHDAESALRWAMHQCWLLPGAVFDTICEKFQTIATSFQAFWHKMTGRPLNPHQDRPDGPEEPGGSDQPSDQIMRSVHEISALCAESLSNGAQLSDLERMTLTILHDATEKSLKADMLAGGAGLAVSYWFYQGYEGLMARRMPKRFIGGGLGLKTTAALITPLLKPLGGLILTAYAWHKFKQSIIQPYQEKHRNEVKDLKTLLTKMILEERQALIQKIETDLHKMTEEFNAKFNTELKALRQETKDEAKKLSHAHEERESVLRQQVATSIGKIDGQLGAIAGDVSDLKGSNALIRDRIGAVLPALASMQHTIGDIKSKTQEELKKLELALGDKKDKKPGLFNNKKK